MGIPIALEHFQLAEILLAMHDIKKICCLEKASDPDYDLLGVYQEDGPNKGKDRVVFSIIWSRASSPAPATCTGSVCGEFPPDGLGVLGLSFMGISPFVF